MWVGELADFVQFAVKFEVSISRGPNRKMVSEFRVICQNVGFLTTLGGYMDFWPLLCMRMVQILRHS